MSFLGLSSSLAPNLPQETVAQARGRQQARHRPWTGPITSPIGVPLPLAPRGKPRHPINGLGFAIDHNLPVFWPMGGGRNVYMPGKKKPRGVSGLGAAAPAKGTRAWWIWYATQYLPQYYSQQQVQSYVYASPYYQQFGSPYQYGSTYNYPYQYTVQQPYPYQQNYQYPYTPYQYPQTQYNQYGQYIGTPYTGYPYGYGQPQYNQYYGEQGPQLCSQQGGYWDYGQNTCNYTGQSYSGGYGGYGSPPNVVGLPEGQAIQMLNQAGYSVWELNVDGQSRGAPPGYLNNRVDISVTNGVVTGSAVG